MSYGRCLASLKPLLCAELSYGFAYVGWATGGNDSKFWALIPTYLNPETRRQPTVC